MPASVPRWSDPGVFEPDEHDELPPELAGALSPGSDGGGSHDDPSGGDAAPAGNGRAADLLTLLAIAVEAVGGSQRSGQTAMAEAVEHAIASGEHLAVQAGTGTGKSLAYLVPALRHAVTSGATIVISTSTIALQSQLVDRDLPRLVTALAEALGRRPTFAILKGRRNYLCLNRLHGNAPEEPDESALFDPFAASALERQVKRLHEWSSETETGDRDELVPGVSEQAWRQVSVTAKECLGAHRCPVGTDCFAEHARSEAGRADIVVTNHALLAIDALDDRPVLPEHDVVMVDEAHDLVDRVTSAATGELSASTAKLAARRCGRAIDQEIADRLDEAGDGLELVLADSRPQRLDEMPRDLAGTLSAVRDAAAACITALGPERTEDVESGTARKLALAPTEEVHDIAVRLLEAFGEEEGDRRDVVWITGDTNRPPSLKVAPLGVGGLLRERMFGQRTTVLTSATLALGGSFDTLARQWGLPPQQAARPATDTAGAKEPPSDTGEVTWTGLDVGSPFDYRRSGILYIARHLPPRGPGELPPEYVDELTELVQAAGGRTLGLFSSMRAAQQAGEALRERLATPVLCQGEDTTALLVNRFAEDPATCLFGTLSLWQGVDVPGESLQLVVMDRIPFPRPDDPLASARQRAVSAHGGNGFLTVAGTHAALLLAQGAGRLLRSSHDRGVIAVLDPRLATARYSSFLRASLPPFWATQDPEVVRGALRRLDAAALDTATSDAAAR
ncbi:ATP-dependent DNA helicase DinG [Halopolyspora algeriensis]|uniref:ATP-dependent helicase DinG n=1 Tax=Halopolyspora algeriensis TaxID=1500506 RepID=A0A368VR04_9ACTN|nr:ATP-dependent DNA helicase [Halopolyspora algeriensis]RCW42897.1 ATP-dependent DNA helicase DinG [Halopolyspora algeriensis]TQM56634.1 ATP-dependent DNA helicase DinG [Halopolyspora algeriensis]